MKHPNRIALTGALMAALVLPVLAGCSGVATKDIEAERAKLHAQPLDMSAKGQPDASIDASGAVKIGPEALPLSDAQRQLTRDYRVAMIDLVDLTLSDASRLADHAMSTAIFGMLTGRMDHAEKTIDRQAEAIAHTPGFCSRLDTLRQRQERMLQSVAPLAPYAKISRQDVEDCAAGRPYEVHI